MHSCQSLKRSPIQTFVIRFKRLGSNFKLILYCRGRPSKADSTSSLSKSMKPKKERKSKKRQRSMKFVDDVEVDDDGGDVFIGSGNSDSSPEEENEKQVRI